MRDKLNLYSMLVPVFLSSVSSEALAQNLWNPSGSGSSTPGGTNGAVQYNAGGAFGGDAANLLYVPGTSPPAAPAVTTHGTAGSTTYAYCVAFRMPTGSSACSPSTTITTGNATLDSTNYNVITPAACPANAAGIDIWLTNPDYTTVGGYEASIACGTSYNDQGASGSNTPQPATDFSQGAFASGLAVGNGDWNAFDINYPIETAQSLALNALLTRTDSDFDTALTIYALADPSIDTDTLFETYQQIYGSLVVPSSNSHNFYALKGMYAGTLFFGSGNIRINYGGMFYGEIFGGASDQTVGAFGFAESSGGTTTLLAGVVADTFDAGGTVNQIAGVYVLGESGAATERDGIFVGDQTGSTSNYAIRTGKGFVSFGDHIANTGSAPTLSSCGSGSPALDATASDTGGTVTEGTTATGCTVTFSGTPAYTTAPHCTVSGSVAYTMAPATTAGFTVANASFSGDTFSYHCEQ